MIAEEPAPELHAGVHLHLSRDLGQQQRNLTVRLQQAATSNEWQVCLRSESLQMFRAQVKKVRPFVVIFPTWELK